MSTAHAHKGPHVMPLSIYLGVGGTLLVMTWVTYFVASIDLGGGWNLAVALSIAFFKGSLVCLFFMHLLYDNKFYMFIFVGSLLFLTLFIVITLFDTLRRGDLNEIRGKTIRENTEHIEEIRANPPKHGGGHDEKDNGKKGEHSEPEHDAAPSTDHDAAPAQ